MNQSCDTSISGSQPLGELGENEQGPPVVPPRKLP